MNVVIDLWHSSVFSFVSFPLAVRENGISQVTFGGVVTIQVLTNDEGALRLCKAPNTGHSCKSIQWINRRYFGMLVLTPLLQHISLLQIFHLAFLASDFTKYSHTFERFSRSIRTVVYMMQVSEEGGRSPGQVHTNDVQKKESRSVWKCGHRNQEVE